MDLILMVLVSAFAFSASDSSVLKDKSLSLEDKFLGESFSFTCSTSDEMRNVGVYKSNMAKGKTQIMNVSVKNGDKTSTITNAYEKRLHFTGSMKEMSITITQLIEEDSGIYWCQYSNVTMQGTVVTIDSKEVATLLVKEPTHCPTVPGSITSISSSIVCPDSSPSIILVSFSIGTAVVVFLMFSIMIAFHIIPKIKTLSSGRSAESRPNDSVYEVMSTTLRRT
ncbi:hypothetical protein ACEWY4_003022 [Coilia grayii]|uniref:Ig-like domain-containing protein n=1 Tax=Coilia grayii TaxID=363190 RepID=A0ABD1KQ11_9TELE